MHITLKWNKQVFENVEIDPSQGVEVFKSQVYSLTGVPMDRQKLMAKGAWIGTLKDDADMSTMKFKEGHAVMLMGTAEVVAAPPVEIKFVEDMSDSQKAETGHVEPAGLQNLGNTCYMNATIECVRHMPEVREALSSVSPSGPSETFAVALRETFNSVDRSIQSIPPMQFVSILRQMFPQFAQTTSRGGYMQQDAEEFYNTMVQSLTHGLQSSGRSMQSLLGFDLQETLTCAESEAEGVTVRRENVNKLVCNIQGGMGSQVTVDHLQEGLKLALEGTVEKHSDVLGRNAIWNKQAKIDSLPRYLCVQFMRFFWKATPESMDHTGVKCKILRPVSYPEIYDVFDLCSDRLKAGLKVNRDKAEKEAEEYFAKKFKSGEGSDVSTAGAVATAAASSSDAMEEDSKPSGDDPLDAPASADSMEEAGAASSSSGDTPDFAFGEGIPSSFRGHYELMGVVTHKGRSADSGHYIGWVRKEAGSDLWWKYDDDKVTEVSTADILNLKGGGDWHTAYLNFYRFKE